MHDLANLLTLAGGLACALLLGYLANRLSLSPIVGYLVAGILVGPFTPGFVADREIAQQFAEIGVILLLFGMGLRFHLNELIAVWRVAVPGALIQSTLSTVALAGLLHLVGWSWTSGLILGMAISVASTVVMALVLGDWRDLHSPIGYIAIGWTVVEDILTVVMLLLLPILFGGGGADAGAGAALAMAGLKIVGLVVTVVVLGRSVVPWALERIERTRSRELFTLAVLVLAVGIAVGAAGIFGVSMELGAFLAGLAVGRTDFAARAAIDAIPMRDAFAVLFFVSVGMLFNPMTLIEAPLPVAMVLLVVILGKPLSAFITVRALGTPMATALPVSAAFSQVGEFSFILATVARDLKLLTDTGWDALVAASIISIALNPTVYGWARRRVTPKVGVAAAAGPEKQAIDPKRSILVGYGPVGRIVHRLLTDRGADVTVVDLNLVTVRELKERGVKSVYGDVLRAGTLDEAGIATAASLVLSTDVDEAPEIVRQARLLNPGLRVLARCAHLRDATALRRAGASVVAAGEAEVGVALAEAVTAGDALDLAQASAQRDALRARLYDVAPGP